MTSRTVVSAALLAFLVACTAAPDTKGGQAATEPQLDLGPIDAATLLPAIRAAAGKYPLVAIAIDTSSPDTSEAGIIRAHSRPATLTFVDSSLTGAAINDGNWMFGPPVTEAEADGCPPEKVLGRQLARILWRAGGKEAGLKMVTVEIQGVGHEQGTRVRHYYYPSQLEGPWVGDPEHRS